MKLPQDPELFMAVFDSASNGITVLRTLYDSKNDITDFEILLVNSYARKWIGDLDYKNRLYGELFPTAKQNGILEKFIEVAKTGLPQKFETRYDGEGIHNWFHFTAIKQGELLVVTTEDISEAKQSEAALKKAFEASERQKRIYDSITGTTPDLLYVFDLKYKFSYANKALLEMWGKSYDEAVGKGLRENGYEEWHAQMHEREIDEVVATKRGIRGTVSFDHAELGKRIYDYIFMPVFDQHGNVEAIAGTTRDITDIKKAENKYRDSEKRLRNMIDQTPAATLVLMGDEFTISQVNKSMLAFIGRGEEIIGKPLIEVMPELNGQYIWEEVKKVYRDGTPFDQWEVHVPHNRTGVRKDYFYNIAYRPLFDDERIIGMIQVVIDVTEQVVARKKLEESEQDLRNLLLQSPIGICLLDATTLVAEIVNDKFVEIAGKSYDEIAGRNYWEAFAEVAKYYEGALREVIQSGKAYKAEEVEMKLIRHGVEETLYVSFVYESMKDLEGTVKKVVIWVLENTLQVKERMKVSQSEKQYKELSTTLEQQVRKRTKELQRSNDDLQQFAHVASHDLKEPVRKIKMFTARLEEHLKDSLDAAALTYMERIHVATNRMFTMIDGVLTYSTLNGSDLRPEKVDLNEIIKSIEVDLEMMLQKTDGRIIIANELPTIEGAAVLLHQLFYNLANNAIKFALPGVPPQITVSSTLKLKKDRRMARIEFRDNGIGFTPHDAERIFDTFVRLHPKDSYEGTGLGLSLCKKIVERHGGTISAQGATGAGACFIIELPEQQDDNNI